MKKEYEKILLEVVFFSTQDIVTASPGDEDYNYGDVGDFSNAGNFMPNP